MFFGNGLVWITLLGGKIVNAVKKKLQTGFLKRGEKYFLPRVLKD